MGSFEALKPQCGSANEIPSSDLRALVEPGRQDNKDLLDPPGVRNKGRLAADLTVYVAARV